jgi:hypothetical protein
VSQCFAQEAIEGSLRQRWLALQLLERGTHLCLAKAEVAQRREDLRANLERPRLHAATVFAAVGMSNAQSTSFVSIDGDLAAMGSAVMRSTDTNEILQRVASAFGTELDMMDVQHVTLLQPGTWQRCWSRSSTARRKAGGMVWVARPGTRTRAGGPLAREERRAVSAALSGVAAPT